MPVSVVILEFSTLHVKNNHVQRPCPPPPPFSSIIFLRKVNLTNFYLDAHIHILFLISRKCMRFSFMDLLQEDLDRVVNNWNNHTIRQTRSSECPHGKPNILYLLPRENGNNYT